MTPPRARPSRPRHATRLARWDRRTIRKAPVRQSSNLAHRATIAGLKAAVHRSKPLSRAGILERLFTLAFERLVYPQIWEDPVVDMKALDIGSGHQGIGNAPGGWHGLALPSAPARGR